MERSIFVTFAGPEGRARVAGYPFLWVKSVEGFVQSAHCAKCLRGTFLKKCGDWVPAPNERTKYVLPEQAKAIYICGVSRLGYAKNLHAPVVPDPHGELIVIPMIDDQRLLIERARLLDIPPLPDGWRGLPKAFTTCRNFQFAVATFGWRAKGDSLLDVAEA